MKPKRSFPDPAKLTVSFDESDIGSGEKTAGERDTEAMLRLVPLLDASDDAASGAAPDPDADLAAVREASDGGHRHQVDASLQRDEALAPLGALDPVPPKGD